MLQPFKDNDKMQAMVSALEASLGVITTACKSVGIDRATHYRWLEDEPEYKEACEELRGVSIDFVETQMFKEIKNGNAYLIWNYLKTQGRKRGYQETKDLNVGLPDNGVSITIVKDVD